MSLWDIILAASGAWVLYLFTLVFYRLYLSPVAAVPGPFLAKITFWYEFYYDCILTGQYTFKLPELHAKYGPIIRINPHEVHITDADFYDTVYAGAGHRREKWKWYLAGFSPLSQSFFATVDHDLHRKRRGALNPYFSMAKVRSLQPVIEERATALCAQFMNYKATGAPIKSQVAFAAASNDIVMQYSFGRSDARVDAPDFKPDYYDAVMSVMNVSHMSKHFPWMVPLMSALPDSVATMLSPGMYIFNKLDKAMSDYVKLIQSQPEDHKYNVLGQPTIFHEIINSALPAEEKTTTRLTHDGQALVAAGTLTTADTLAYAMFYLLSDPAALRRLKDELTSLLPPDSEPGAFPSLVALEQLPYFTAVIKECLRLSNGGSTRLARISPIEPVVFKAKAKDGGKEYCLPPGTPMSMTHMLIHFNSDYFEDPMEFLPDRWMKKSKPDKYFRPFNAGTRQCLGENLARAELYLIIGKIFLTFGGSFPGGEVVRFKNDQGVLELYETTKRDVTIWADALVPLAPPGSQGVRFVVKD